MERKKVGWQNCLTFLTTSISSEGVTLHVRKIHKPIHFQSQELIEWIVGEQAGEIHIVSIQELLLLVGEVLM